ncbi:uncharacterized protein LOC17879171 isoform X1 [Capsella rubella]|uniref:uncharacterized protein LOC17879171 isoform X1 n=1 Tax=Capsella rubella TaxID=81985 RepID=UPI000CD4E4F3|nr:uncharacterized protein LOC17879171 isoform X1 [Capsella rubella]
MCSYCQMSRVSKEAGDEDTTKFEDRTELVSPPLKKPKIDAEDAKAETEVVKSKMRILRKGNWKDPEYIRQEDLFEEQFVKSEGYDVDWDKLYFKFPAIKFESASSLSTRLTNQEVLDLCIKTAIREENEESIRRKELPLVSFLSALVLSNRFFCFFAGNKSQVR